MDFSTLITVTAIQSTGFLIHFIKATQNCIDTSLVKAPMCRLPFF
jgi:hypothetical protein